jgi:hypothetical protein
MDGKSHGHGVLAKSQSTRQRVAMDYVIPLVAEILIRPLRYKVSHFKVRQLHTVQIMYILCYTLSSLIQVTLFTFLQSPYRGSSSQIAMFFLSLLHFESWTTKGVERYPSRTKMTKVRYEGSIKRGQNRGVHDTTSPPPISFRCGNIAKLSLFRCIRTYPCPLLVLCPQESWHHSSHYS